MNVLKKLIISKQLNSFLWNFRIISNGNSTSNITNKTIIVNNLRVSVHINCKMCHSLSNSKDIEPKKNYVHVETSEKGKKIQSKTSRKKKSCVVPSLSSEKLKEITNLVGITVGLCHISWARISLTPFSLLDWNAKELPLNFRSSQNEQNVLKFVYNLKNALPPSDLYVMETFSLRGREFYEKINTIQLLSMLTVLLNGIDKDPDDQQKVIFQKEFVMNKLHSLLVGSERVSTRLPFENILYKTGSPDFYSMIEISQKQINFYQSSYVEKQEDLSLAFLFTLTFLDVNILRNKKSISKIQNREVQ